jgi:hypothetical protein
MIVPALVLAGWQGAYRADHSRSNLCGVLAEPEHQGPSGRKFPDSEHG